VEVFVAMDVVMVMFLWFTGTQTGLGNTWLSYTELN